MPRKPNGFSRHSPDERKAIAASGGKAARDSAHRFTSAEAKQAGQKGGRARKRKVRR